MREISPSQFIEAILESQKINSVSLTKLKVRTFNEMVDRLYGLNICVQFGFSDLIDFVEDFEESLPYADFAIRISYTEAFLDEMKEYNQIYTSVKNFIEINEVWKNLIK
ncbi:hypothetical protein QUW11_12700 [Mediterranea massiliensis]|uniref:hypothetical protein n=1 Tax=Mediterranea massiliensis TaxID=1841865 RepID=UPI0025A49FD7|nr:hypothetical protein [Mediterranea massiliensis]MDM8199373.1 hypothetical protein [Mediterranea massiliensis]